MRQGFGGILWSSFRKVYGPVLTVGAFILTFLVYVFAFDENTLLRAIFAVVAFVFIVMITLIFTFGHAAYETYRTIGGRLPEVLQVKDPFPGTSGTLVCLLEPSELFSYGIGVSFYSVNRQGFEVLVGVGTVINIQQDGKIQVSMINTVPGQEAFADRLRQNEYEAMRTTLVKPNIPIGYASSREIENE